MSKAKIGMGKLHRYIKSRGIRSSVIGVSPYRTCCKALEIDGRPQPSATTWKSWVLKNYDFIVAEANKFNEPKEKLSKRQKSSLVAVANVARKEERVSGAESRVTAFISNSKIDPNSPEFLLSFEWRALRMKALKLHGRRCQCCGATPETGATMHVDHIKPRKTHPGLALAMDNLQVLCHECNHGKGNWDTSDWR